MGWKAEWQTISRNFDGFDGVKCLQENISVCSLWGFFCFVLWRLNFSDGETIALGLGVFYAEAVELPLPLTCLHRFPRLYPGLLQ